MHEITTDSIYYAHGFTDEMTIPNHLVKMLMHKYHLARLEAITDEMIEKRFPERSESNPNQFLKVNVGRQEGAKWVKHTLLSNLQTVEPPNPDTNGKR